MTLSEIVDLIGQKNEDLLILSCKTVVKEQLRLPSPDFIDKVFNDSNRNGQTLKNLITLLNTGRLSGAGYLSFMAVDQGVEYGAGDCAVPKSYCLIF